MRTISKLLCSISVLASFGLSLTGCQAVHSAVNPVNPLNPPPVTFQLSVSVTGSGTVTSSPTGLSCGQICTASFAAGTVVTLTATPATRFSFGGWSGACSGPNLCRVTLSTNQTVQATFNPPTLQSINHIIFLAQENRSLDHYFGALRGFWAQNGYPDQAFDGLPQFNNPAGARPTNPGCNPNSPPPNNCNADPSNPITSFHLLTQCIENPSPSWNESHVDWNVSNPVSPVATLDGFVQTAANNARRQNPPYNDVDGVRAMGYYDGGDLNYYYSLASSFATSDRWFSPVMSRTDPNRMYLLAATSQGHVYPLDQTNPPRPKLTATTIVQELQNAGVTWKIYINPTNTGCTTTDSSCLAQNSSLRNFSYIATVLSQFPQNIVPIQQYFTDVQNGALPNVGLIEPAFAAGLDEHPTVNDQFPTQIQLGAQYVAGLINALLGTASNPSPSWKDSVFILTFDEGGGLYDHVAPQPAVSPDGIPPSDLLPGDVCTQLSGPNCDFTYTGYRVPLIVVSPFTKKNYVSHTVADYTAILKLIETRFNLPPLTKRDAAQMDMTEFFDFTNMPWATPPSPSPQSTSDPCYIDHLP